MPYLSPLPWMYRPMACACVGWRGVMRVWLVGGGKGSGSSASGRIIPHRCVHQRRPGCGVCVVLPSVAVPLACAHPAPSIRLPALPIQHPPSCRRESAPYGPPACRRWGAPAPPSSHPTPDTHSCRHSNTRQAAEGDHQVGLLLDLVLVNVVVEGVPAAGGRHTQKWVGCGAAMGWLVRCNGMSALVRTC